MPFIPAPDCARVEFRMTLDSQLIENVCHFRFIAGAPDQADLDALAAFCVGWWQTLYADIISASVVLREVVVTGLDSDLGPQSTAGGGSAPGEIADEAMPNNVALCVTKRTASIGRSARGRWFIAGLTNGQVTGNLISSGDATSIEARLNQLFVTDAPPGWEGVVLSYQHAGAVLTTAVAYPITICVVRDLVVDSQRRRLPGRGA